MGSELKYTDRSKVTTAIYFGVILVFDSFLGVFMLRSAFKNTYPDLMSLGIGLFLLSGVVILLWYLRSFNTFKFYEDRVEIYSVFGPHRQTVLLWDIKTWSETKVSNEGKEWMVLTLYTDSGSFSISSNKLPDYTDIKNLITTGKQEVAPPAKNQYNKSYGYPLMAGGVLLLCIACVSFAHWLKPVLPANLTTITFQLDTQPQYIPANEGPAYLEFQFKKYPGFNFSVSDNALSWQNIDSLMRKFRYHDSITLEFNTDEYEVKLLKTKPVNPLDLGPNFHSITIYGLKYKDRKYVSLDSYHGQTHSNNLIVVPMFSGLLGLLLLLMGYRYRKKGSNQTN